jgi:hypothetical protein
MSSTTIEMGELFSVAGPIYVSVGAGMFAYEARTEGAIIGGADITAQIWEHELQGDAEQEKQFPSGDDAFIEGSVEMWVELRSAFVGEEKPGHRRCQDDRRREPSGNARRLAATHPWVG